MKNDYDKFCHQYWLNDKITMLNKLKYSISYYIWLKQNQDINDLMTMNLSSKVGLKINYLA
jgi:hypothetical protein